MAKQVKKEELGLGISALFKSKNLDTSSEEKLSRDLTQQVATIPLAEIRVNPEQPRKDFEAEALATLSRSIETFGLIQPITVRYLGPGEFQLISGERRLRASKMAGLTEVPAYVRLAGDKQEMLEMALVENTHREDLNAIEVALAYQRLVEECKLSHKALSERVGKERSTITNYLRLLELSAEVQQAIRDKDISMGHARALLALESRKDQAKALHQVLSQQLSVRDTEKLIRQWDSKGTSKKAGPVTLDSDYKKVQQDFRAFFGSGSIELKVNEQGKGQIVIPFQDTEELNRLIDRLEE